MAQEVSISFRGIDDGLAAQAAKSAQAIGALSDKLQSTQGNLKGFSASLAQLASATGRNLGQSAQLANSLGLSAKAAAEAASAISQLQSTGSSAAQRFAVLNRELGLTYTQFQKLDNAVAGARSAFQSTGAEAGRFNSVLQGIGQGIGSNLYQSLTQSIVGLGQAFAGFITGSVNAAQQLQIVRNQLELATGSAEGADKAFKFIEQTSAQLGLNFADTAQSFAKFAISARGTALEGKGVEDVFRGVSTAVRVNNLSAAEANGVFLALNQVLSKGKVQAEELRGQLGERLPGAFQVAARALGVTTGELDKLLETGKVTAEDFLPKFGAQLEKEFGGGVAASLETVNASIADIGNQIFKAQAALGAAIQPAVLKSFELLGQVLSQAGDQTNAIDILTKAVEGFVKTLEDSPDLVDQLSGALASLADILASIAGGSLTLAGNAIKLVSQNADLLRVAIEALTVRFLALKAVELGQFFTSLVSSIAALRAASAAGVLSPLLLQLLASQGAAGTAAVSFFALRAAIAAAGGVVPFLIAGLRGLAVSLAPILIQFAAVAAAIKGIEFAKFANDLADANTALAGANAGVSATANTALAAAQRTKNAIDQLNQARSSGRGLTEQETANARKLFEANKLRLDQLDEELQKAKDLPAANDEQTRTKEALIKSTESAIDVLSKQNDQLGEAAGLTGQLGNANKKAAIDQAELTKRIKEQAEALKQAREAQKTEAQRQQQDRNTQLEAQLKESERKAEQDFQDKQRRDKEKGDREARDQKRKDDENFRLQEQNFKDAEEQRDRSYQAEKEARERAFNENERNLERSFEDQKREAERAFNEQQRLEERSFREEQAKKQEELSKRFDAARQQVDRQVQLRQAASPEERAQLQQQFAKQDATDRLRKQLEQQQQVDTTNLTGGGTNLNTGFFGNAGATQEDQKTAEQKLADQQTAFEDTQRLKEQQFQDAQRQADEQFQTAKEERDRAFKAEQQAADLQYETDKQARERAFQAELNAIKAQVDEENRQLEIQFDNFQRDEERAFRAALQSAEEQFKAAQRQADRQFNDEQRALDLQNAQQVKALLESAKPKNLPQTIADNPDLLSGRRSGGPVEAGTPYWVGEGPGGQILPSSEIVVPKVGSYVIAAEQAQKWLKASTMPIPPIDSPNLTAIPSPVALPVQVGPASIDTTALLEEVKSLRQSIEGRNPQVNLSMTLPRSESDVDKWMRAQRSVLRAMI